MLYLIYQIKKGVIDMTKKELKAVENILTESKKKCRITEFHEPFIDDGGFESICDGYRVVRFYRNCLGAENIAVTKTQKFFEAFVDTDEEIIPIDLPTIEELRKEVRDNIGRATTKKKLYYRLGNDTKNAVVNVRYLIDIMELLHTDKIYYAKEHRKNSSLLLKSEIGEAILLPIMSRSDDERNGYWVYNC